MTFDDRVKLTLGDLLFQLLQTQVRAEAAETAVKDLAAAKAAQEPKPTDA